jgi:hypothetical protein
VARRKVRVGIEITPKKAFASALDWPGWTRAGRDPQAALEALAAAAPRYATCARAAGVEFDRDETAALDVVEEAPGNATTAFGAPDVRFEADRRRTTQAEAERLAAIAAAAWELLDRVAERAPAELRKGPRGGGRDRDKMLAHVVGSDGGYARSIGIKRPEIDPVDRAARDSLRAAILDVLRQPSDGSPIAGGKWPPRYAARRIAWHALDHAWEIEDRSEPAD